MRSNLAVAVSVVMCLSAAAFGGTRSVVPTTTLAAETGNNTSAAASFTSQTDGNLGARNISKVSISTLLSQPAGPVFAHLMGWFGPSNHMNVGYTSSDPAQVQRQVTDALSRGIGGFILDWYGPNNSMPNNTAFALMNETQSRQGAFRFGVMYDGGALGVCAGTAGCDLNQQAIQDLTYAYKNFESSPAYMLVSGRPVVWFFDADRYGTLNWPLIAASVPGNPMFIFRNAGGFSQPMSSGSFSWVIINLSNSLDWGQSYLDNFYLTSLSFPTELTYATAYKGFNDSLASWGAKPPRIMSQQCGQVWVETLAEVGKYSLPLSQLGAVQLVTWNDYEEGSELETGIDNCVTVSAAVNGNLLSWSTTGNLNMVDHFTVFISSDGQNLMPLGDFPASASSLDLTTAGMAPGNYALYVKAVGKPSLANQMSAAVAYKIGDQPPHAALAVTPGSGAAPLAVTASTAGSYDPDGTLVGTTILFGDGSSASAASATHTYSVPGSYTVTAQITDNAGLSAAASAAVRVYGVKVTSPANGATATSPVHVVASAIAANPITAMRIYVDNVSHYYVRNNAVNAYIPMSGGPHYVVVQAWDNTGKVYKTPLNITVR